MKKAAMHIFATFFTQLCQLLYKRLLSGLALIDVKVIIATQRDANL